MPNREIESDLNGSVGFDLQEITTNTTTVGNIIDLQSIDAFSFHMISGELTDGTYTPLIEEGDDSGLSDAADVADADLTVTEASVVFADTDDDTVKTIGYTGDKRFVRLSFVSAGTSSGGFMAAVAVKGKPDVSPH